MLNNLPQYIAWTRKAIVQVIGLCAALLSLGLLPDPYSGWVAGAVAVLTTVLHFITPNADAPGTVPAVDADLDEDSPENEKFKPAELVTPGQIAAQHEQAKPPTDTTLGPIQTGGGGGGGAAR